MLKRLTQLAATAVLAVGLAGAANAARIDTTGLGTANVVSVDVAATANNLAGVLGFDVSGVDASVFDDAFGFAPNDPGSYAINTAFLPGNGTGIFASEIGTDTDLVEFLFQSGPASFLLATFELASPGVGDILANDFFFAPGTLTLTEFTSAVPLPAAAPLLASGVLLIGFAARRRRKA